MRTRTQKARNVLFSSCFKELKDFSLGKIKMFELLEDAPASVFYLYSLLKDKNLEEIKLEQNNVIYYFKEFEKFIPEGEKITTLISSPNKNSLITKEGGIYFDYKENVLDRKYVVASLEKRNGLLHVICEYLDDESKSKKGTKIIVFTD